MNTYHMGTKCVQGGYTPGNGEPRQVPIIQSTTFKYNTSEDMGKLFDLEASGYFYTRLQNPTEDELTDQSYESYSDLDELGRCGVAASNIGTDLMPTGKRGKIGQVKPSGWQTIKFDNVDGKYLYNRCHLIGYQLTAENANEKNLITGTRYMNVDGMLPFENMVADYIKETDNHVMYRVTPVFEGGNLVASGVLMEAESVEDHGEGVKFNVYVYNVQPGITIDYATGKAVLSDTDASAGTGKTSGNTEKKMYVLNENTKKFHTPECSGVKDIKEGNKKTFTGSREELTKEGYSPCGRCKP